MAQLQSALPELADQLTGTDPTLTLALADIVRAALQESRADGADRAARPALIDSMLLVVAMTLRISTSNARTE